MIHVAVIAREKNWFDQIITRLSGLPISFKWFDKYSTFANRKDVASWQFIYFIENNFNQLQDGIVQIKEQDLKIPIVCSVPKLSYDQKQLLYQLDVKEIIFWPITRQELEYFFKAWSRFLESYRDKGEDVLFQGSLEFVDGVELLQSLCQKENTGILSFNWGERKGRIELNNGQIVQSAYRQLDPLTSILVLTSWNHGTVSFKEEAFISKRSIMLTNEQIFEECKQYQQERLELLKNFPSPDVPLFTHPDLNFEDFGASERTWLYKMYKGKTLSEINDLYEGDFNFLLKKLNLWLEKQYIVPEETYHLIKAKKEKEMSTSGLKRLMSKIFKSEEKEQENLEKSNAQQQKLLEKAPYLFNDLNLINTFKAWLEDN